VKVAARRCGVSGRNRYRGGPPPREADAPAGGAGPDDRQLRLL
jgi:hypothetical protein